MDISVVIPVYRCRATLNELCERLENTLGALPGIGEFEIILVEDGCPDDSWAKIKEIAARRPNVLGAQLSRNFGQHNAITAGLSIAHGNWAIVMDGDLQDRPEDIESLWKLVSPEIDVVCARRERKEHSWWRRAGSKLTYRAFSLLSGVHLDPAITNFRIINRTVIDAYLGLRGKNRILGPNMEWLGFNTVYLDLAHDVRPKGRSSYSVSRLLRMAIDVIISHSNRPLYLSIWLGSFIFLMTLVVIAYVFYSWIANGRGVGGWTSVILSIWCLGGAIIANLGLLGVYIGKIYEETKARPNFIIARTVNIDKEIQGRRAPLDLATGHDVSPELR